MKIAIDFDGVICKREGIPTNRNWVDAKPMEGALDSINLFIKQGIKVWVFTSNEQPDKVKEFLAIHGFPDLKVTNLKEPAHVYIDDRALRFTNWQDMRKYFV